MAQSVRLHPPRGKRRLNLYEFSMSEPDFVANRRSLANFFTGEHIEGVYETRIPLLTRALYELGSVAKVRADQRWTEADDDNDEEGNEEGDEEEHNENGKFNILYCCMLHFVFFLFIWFDFFLILFFF